MSGTFCFMCSCIIREEYIQDEDHVKMGNMLWMKRQTLRDYTKWIKVEKEIKRELCQSVKKIFCQHSEY